MLNTSVLVTNKAFIPIHITTVKRALCLLYANIARAVDREFRVFDYNSWCELSVEKGDDVIGTVSKVIKVPRVIALNAYDRIPKRNVRFSRYNIYLRDKNTCQYCGVKYPKNELNIDHIIPRSRGGKTLWTNIVLSCIECNRKKGGRLPEEAGMQLIKKPVKPKWTPFFMLTIDKLKYEEWKPFFNLIDASYWNVELEE